MKERLAQYLDHKRKRIDEALRRVMAEEKDVPAELKEAMNYSLFAGGKRLRPVLTLTVAEALSAPLEPVTPFACAIEMIHTYSLIHDDLPSMDDDDTRRGRPTNHKVFGEAMAILAGDALLTKAFGLMTRCSSGEGADAEKLIKLIDEASHAAGAEGMVGGQVKDILAETNPVSVQELTDIHRLKTGALLRLSVRAGAILSGATLDQLDALTRYADNIGLAFQIQDDVLDIVGDQEKTGKPTGRDEARHKATFPALIGLTESKKRVQTLVEEAKTQVTAASGIRAEWLCEIADYLVDREA